MLGTFLSYGHIFDNLLILLSHNVIGSHIWSLNSNLNFLYPPL
jgi:hypothetical protein